MLNKSTILLLGCLLLASLSPIWASTIIPFPNLGEMAKASPIVVLATAEENFEIEINESTRFRTSFKVIDLIKGELDNRFVIQSLSLRKGDLNRTVFGDMAYKAGGTYLLFLEDNGDYCKTIMLSHGIFRQFEKDNKTLLSPVEGGLNFFELKRPDGQAVEPFYVYDQNRMVDLLKQVTNESQAWNSALARTTYPPAWFQAEARAEPAHCTFIGAPTPYARWTDFPGTPLPVHYGVGGDAGCPSANAKVQGVIGALNSNYTGLNMSDGGTHSFVPSCTGGEDATDLEFRNWVSTNLGGTRHIVVQYDDPCSEITDLTGCSGTLGIGGLYWFTSTHVWDGTNWNPGAWGYVVVNNGTGACQCPSTDYDMMMIHELTHSLGIGHIAAADGAANMNPMCCVASTALDVACLDYTYAPLMLPVELQSFSGELVDNVTELKWTTLSETQNDFFTVERSVDGIHYESIGTITAAGSSTQEQHYNFVDSRPAYGANYYRLQQTNLDRTSNYAGETVLVEYIDDGIVELRPNPVKADQIELMYLTRQASSNIDTQIFDINGQLLGQQQFAGLSGRNDLLLDVGHLKVGVYILKIQNGTKVKSMRFIKVD